MNRRRSDTILIVGAIGHLDPGDYLMMVKQVRDTGQGLVILDADVYTEEEPTPPTIAVDPAQLMAAIGNEIRSNHTNKATLRQKHREMVRGAKSKRR